jgi:hypothetical protein
MKMLRRHIALFFTVWLFGLTFATVAADFGDAGDVKKVRKLVAAKFGRALHASVSHDWALCTGYTREFSVSVVLHRSAPHNWTIVQSDGGAYVDENLKSLGVPMADIPSLLKAYQ